MRRDDRDDPFDDIFREIERMMDDMMGEGQGLEGGDQSGFATETHVNVHETADEIRIVADLPGIEKDDIAIQCDGETVTISAHTAAREYDERISLPGRVDARSGEATYNNGVLEATFERTDSSTNIDVQ